MQRIGRYILIDIVDLKAKKKRLEDEYIPLSEKMLVGSRDDIGYIDLIHDLFCLQGKIEMLDEILSE